MFIITFWEGVIVTFTKKNIPVDDFNALQSILDNTYKIRQTYYQVDSRTVTFCVCFGSGTSCLFSRHL